MVGQIATIRLISFSSLLAGRCARANVLQLMLRGVEFDGSNSLEVQRQEMRTWRSLPNAPTVQPPTQIFRNSPPGEQPTSSCPGPMVARKLWGSNPRFFLLATTAELIDCNFGAKRCSISHKL
jgi:hypothetical protein